MRLVRSLSFYELVLTIARADSFSTLWTLGSALAVQKIFEGSVLSRYSRLLKQRNNPVKLPPDQIMHR